MKQENYIPYGVEWEKELMKCPKKFLIDMLKKELTKSAEEGDSLSIDSLLAEFNRQGFDTSNWDGDEGSEKAIVDGVVNQFAEKSERIEELEKQIVISEPPPNPCSHGANPTA